MLLSSGLAATRTSKIPRTLLQKSSVWSNSRLHLSAILVADWLCTGFRNTRTPLGTVDLFVSDPRGPFSHRIEPNAEERTIEVPSLEVFKSAARAWVGRTRENADNIAVFYF